MTSTPFNLLNTFTLVKTGNSAVISCKGCSELLDTYAGMPAHIRGIVKFDSKLIPVVDFALQFLDKSTEIGLNSSLLVIQHRSTSNDRNLYSAVLLKDFDEVLILSQTDFLRPHSKKLSYNANFIINLANSTNAESLLEKNHSILMECSINTEHQDLEELIKA
jgi:chemotaxis signal transduction protein